jgi:anti-anti-sigma factor
MTPLFEPACRPPLEFHVVADDGQIVHARVDGRLAHRFRPVLNHSSGGCQIKAEWERNRSGPLVNDAPHAIAQDGDEPLAAAIGCDAYQRRVLLNLSAVTGMDTSGVNWLLTLQKRMDAVGGRLVLHSLSPAVRSVVRVLKLNGALKVAVDEFDAEQRM